jgi:hypothetical protein
MDLTLPRRLLETLNFWTSQEYFAKVPQEDFMDTPNQATQREITLESFALLKRSRPEVHYFNGLLVQYPYRRTNDTRQVVPDNMVVLHNGPIELDSSYDVPLQPTGPFLILDYFSKYISRNDSKNNFHMYERELKVPYYLVFSIDAQDLTLCSRTARKYVSVKPNEAGRLAIPELDLEVALLDGWARYWYRGELLQLPGDLQTSLDESREATRQAEAKASRAEERARRAEGKEAEERRQKEKLLAQLRTLGVQPDL